jgi:DNA invertase Pin-like site-specific DNA recombinase
MHRSKRTWTLRRALWPAAALLCAVAADGVLSYSLGGPLWLVPLYGAAGVAMAVGWLWFAGRRDRPAAAQAAPAAAVPTSRPAGRALGYIWLQDGADGALDEPTREIEQACVERGLELQLIVHDRVGTGHHHARPALSWALKRIAAGEVGVLVVARLRDLSPDVANLASLLRWFEEVGRTLIALDMRIDTSTEPGRIAALALAGVGGWERERLSEPTVRPLEVAPARGAGNRGAAVADVPELHERIAGMRERGMTLQAIADQLNEDRVPTLRGGAMWRPSSVQRATGYRRPSASNRGIELPRSRPSQR